VAHAGPMEQRRWLAARAWCPVLWGGGREKKLNLPSQGWVHRRHVVF
jgi:hypothetical protein